MGRDKIKATEKRFQASSLTENEDSERYLEFCLGDETYAVPLLKVREVIAMPETVPVPSTPLYFLGIMNLRGQVISVIDLRKKIGIEGERPTGEAAEEIAVIIIDLNPIFLGVVVDSVNSVLTVHEDKMNPPPQLENNKNTDYITGVYRKTEENLILLLDIAKVLDINDKQVIRDSIENAG